MWTNQDLAEMTQLALALTDRYCECCAVVKTSNQYCDGCADEIVNWLLWEEYAKNDQYSMLAADENIRIEKGLY
jgi:predicted Fe-S protein YdhL (DUF1289 family)